LPADKAATEVVFSVAVDDALNKSLPLRFFKDDPLFLLFLVNFPVAAFRIELDLLLLPNDVDTGCDGVEAAPAALTTVVVIISATAFFVVNALGGAI